MANIVDNRFQRGLGNGQGGADILDLPLDPTSRVLIADGGADGGLIYAAGNAFDATVQCAGVCDDSFVAATGAEYTLHGLDEVVGPGPDNLLAHVIANAGAFPRDAVDERLTAGVADYSGGSVIGDLKDYWPQIDSGCTGCNCDSEVEDGDCALACDESCE